MLSGHRAVVKLGVELVLRILETIARSGRLNLVPGQAESGPEALVLADLLGFDRMIG
jgi:hypothetical protein